MVDDGSSIGDTSSSDDDLILARGKSTDKSFDKDNASSSILRKRTALEADLDVSFIDHNSDQSNIRVTSMSNSSLDTKAMQLVSINRPRNSLNSTKRCTSGDQEEGEIIEEVDNSFIVDLTELEDTQDQDNSVTGKQRRMLLINYLKGLYDHMKVSQKHLNYIGNGCFSNTAFTALVNVVGSPARIPKESQSSDSQYHS